MKNRILSVLILLAMLMCTFCGCASNEPSVKSNENTENNETTVETPDLAETSDDTQPDEADTTKVLFGDPADSQATGLLAASASTSSYSADLTKTGTMYIHVTGIVQGEIKGDCQEGGNKKDKIIARDFSERVSVPTDSSGSVTGGRKYEPATFIHFVDCSSPKLRKALSDGEYLTISVDFYRMRADGTMENFYTVTYENAILISMNMFEGERNSHYEEVSFTFDKVTYTYHDGNLEFSDKRLK